MTVKNDETEVSKELEETKSNKRPADKTTSEMDDKEDEKKCDCDSDEDCDCDEKDMEEENRPADKDNGEEKADEIDEPVDDSEEENPDAKKAFDATQKKPDMKEDINALFSGEELSEEFKSKVQTIFEAAVHKHIKNTSKDLSEKFTKELEDRVKESEDALVERVDTFLNYVVEKYIDDNKLAIDRGITIESCKSLISGFRKLFTEHNITVPEGSDDLVEEQASKIEELEKKLNESVAKEAELSKELATKKQEEILDSACKDLASTDAEKFKELAKGTEFTTAEEYETKIGIIRESYFKGDSETEATSTDGTVDGGLDIEEKKEKTDMDIYSEALSKLSKRNNWS